MKKQIFKQLVTTGMVVVLSGFCTIALSQNTGAVKLEYKYPAEKAVKYLNKSTMAQVMDIEGQTMQTDVNSAFGCSVRSAGSQDNDLKLEFTIDTLGQTTNSPMGGAGGPIMSVKGKICNVIITPEGKTVDITEASNLTFNIEGSGESNMSQSITEFFQLLPVTPVKAGDTWNLTDSASIVTPTTTMKTIDNSDNKLEGFETIDGIECAKITSTHEGSWSMNIQSQGYDISIRGPYTATSECLFAVKEGYFIKNSSTTKMTGELDLISMGMTMPIVIEMNSVNEIVK